MEKSSNWKIISVKESKTVGLIHLCGSKPLIKGDYRGIMDFSNIKNYEKMISRCPKCGETIPIDIKARIKVEKIMEKYDL